MGRPTKDTEIKALKELRKIAEKNPMKALVNFVEKVVIPADPKGSKYADQ